jgi:hypothetical protein
MKRLGVLIFAGMMTASMAACGSSPDTQATAPSTTAESPLPSVAPTTTAQGSFTAQDAIDAFKAAGLEAENPFPMTREDYGIAPLVAAEGIRFFIPSIGADKGGRALSFDTDADLQKMKDYYDGLGKQSAAFFSHVFVRDNVLVQITGDLPDDQAAKYDKALQGM